MPSAVSLIMYCSEVGATLMTWGVDRLYAKKKGLAVKTVPERAYQQHLICFPLTRWKRNHKSMCLLEQIELGGCVLNGRAPGVLNNDSQSPLARSVWECSAGEVWMEKNLLSKQRSAAVSAARPERLSSAVHIVFGQLALICHLVEGAFVAREGKHCVVINGEST